MIVFRQACTQGCSIALCCQFQVTVGSSICVCPVTHSWQDRCIRESVAGAVGGASLATVCLCSQVPSAVFASSLCDCCLPVHYRQHVHYMRSIPSLPLHYLHVLMSGSPLSPVIRSGLGPVPVRSSSNAFHLFHFASGVDQARWRRKAMRTKVAQV